MALGFRAKLLLGVGLAVALAAGFQLAFSYLALVRAAENGVRRELLLFAQSVYQALDLSGPLPALREEGYALLAPFAHGRARLSKEGRTYLQYGGPLPEGGGWMKAAWSLPEGYALEVALPRPSLGFALPALALALPLALGVALGITWVLLKEVLRPLRRLARAVEVLSRERFPEPVPVPPGGDEVARLAEGFNRMVEAVRGFLDRERTFARHAAHELRTPVASLRSQLEAVERGLFPWPEALPRLKRQVDRLESLLEGLRLLVRGEQAEERVALREILQELAPAWPGVAFHLEVPGTVRGSREVLARVVGNLLENAHRHGRPPVAVRLWEEGRWVRLSVRDHGPGVPEEALAHLGVPFFRGPGSPGLGLGLALVRRAVEGAGGRVAWANAGPGFLVQLSWPKEAPWDG